MKTLKLKKKYETYPEYKDSGVEWFGNIPKGWKVGPVRSVLKERVEKNTKLVSDNILSVMKDVGVIRYADKGDIGNKSSDRPEHYKIVHAGDIVVNSMNLVIGSVGQSRELGVTSSVYIIYYPKNQETSSDYYHYLFRDKSWQKTLGRRLGKGIMELRESIKPYDLRLELVPIPSLSEQNKIVGYLDEKTSLIDQTISKKQKLIELLREKRTAVINRAVTKGLDLDVEMVESGVEWIGKIPKGWKMRKLFHLFETIGSGTTPDEKYLTDKDEGIPWVNTGDLTDYYMEIPSKRVVPEAIREISTLKVFSKNSVVIAMYGATIGKLGIPKFNFCTNQACCVLENPVSEVSEKFIYFWLLGNKKYIIELGVGGGQPNINKDIVKSLKISLPTLGDQLKIVDYLELKIDNYNKSIKQVEKSIELLQEFKSSLISNVVTGKIKI